MKSYRVILLDHNPVSKLLLEAVLKFYRYEVETVGNWADVVSRAREGKGDLIISDEWGDLPEKLTIKQVILSDAEPTTEHLNRLRQEDAFLVKRPFTPHEFIQKIEKILA